MRTIDLNCDLGESFGAYKIGEQEEIYKYITSANIACGFHAGDSTVMRETVEKALEYGVKIGAHPGLPDLQGFGRREIAITPQEAYDLVVYQIGALQAILQTKGAVMQHVKPHGALYNMAARDRALADAIAQAVYDVSPSLILYGLAGSESTAAAEAIGLQTVHEVFADRTYQVDGTLTPRTQPNAIITNEDTAIAQVLLMVQTGHVKSVQGDLVPIKADSICVHGDNPNAVAFVKKLRQALETANIDVKAF